MRPAHPATVSTVTEDEMVVVVVMLAQYRSVPQNSPQVDPRAQHFVSQVVLLTTQYLVFGQQAVELMSEPGVG